MIKNRLIIIIGLIAFIVIVGGVSYSFFVYNKDVVDVTLNTGDISINLANINGNLTLSNVIPKTEYEGKNSTSYLDFTVNATVDTEAILYDLEIIPRENNTMNTNYVKVYLTDQKNNVLVSPFYYNELLTNNSNNGKIFYEDVVNSANGEVSNVTKTFRLRIWLDENYPELTSKTFNFDINLHAYNVDGSKYKKVTFNTQDERVGLSKYVAVGEEYGALPTPTKPGYAFLGWNGKNLINIADENISFEDKYYKNDETSNPKYILLPNKDYVLSFDHVVNSATSTIYSSVGYGVNWFSVDISMGNMSSYSGTGRKAHNFTTPSSFNTDPPYVWFRLVRFTIHGDADVDISNIQLEEGSTATAYEPYYVDNTVTVTQEKDHVLTAIWQKNS